MRAQTIAATTSTTRTTTTITIMARDPTVRYARFHSSRVPQVEHRGRPVAEVQVLNP